MDRAPRAASRMTRKRKAEEAANDASLAVAPAPAPAPAAAPTALEAAAPRKKKARSDAGAGAAPAGSASVTAAAAAVVDAVAVAAPLAAPAAPRLWLEANANSKCHKCSKKVGRDGSQCTNGHRWCARCLLSLSASASGSSVCAVCSNTCVCDACADRQETQRSFKQEVHQANKTSSVDWRSCVRSNLRAVKLAADSFAASTTRGSVKSVAVDAITLKGIYTDVEVEKKRLDEPPQTVVLLGEKGAGKSTTLNMWLHSTRPSASAYRQLNTNSDGGVRSEEDVMASLVKGLSRQRKENVEHRTELYTAAVEHAILTETEQPTLVTEAERAADQLVQSEIVQYMHTDARGTIVDNVCGESLLLPQGGHSTSQVCRIRYAPRYALLRRKISLEELCQRVVDWIHTAHNIRRKPSKSPEETKCLADLVSYFRALSVDDILRAEVVAALAGSGTGPLSAASVSSATAAKQSTKAKQTKNVGQVDVTRTPQEAALAVIMQHFKAALEQTPAAAASPTAAAAAVAPRPRSFNPRTASVIRALNVTECFISSGRDVDIDRLWVRNLLRAFASIESPDQDYSFMAHTLSDMVVYSPSSMLSGDHDFCDIPGTGDLLPHVNASIERELREATTIVAMACPIMRRLDWDHIMPVLKDTGIAHELMCDSRSTRRLFMCVLGEQSTSFIIPTDANKRAAFDSNNQLVASSLRWTFLKDLIRGNLCQMPETGTAAEAVAAWLGELPPAPAASVAGKVGYEAARRLMSQPHDFREQRFEAIRAELTLGEQQSAYLPFHTVVRRLFGPGHSSSKAVGAAASASAAAASSSSDNIDAGAALFAPSKPPIQTFCFNPILYSSLVSNRVQSASNSNIGAAAQPTHLSLQGFGEHRVLRALGDDLLQHLLGFVDRLDADAKFLVQAGSRVRAQPTSARAGTGSGTAARENNEVFTKAQELRQGVALRLQNSRLLGNDKAEKLLIATSLSDQLLSATTARAVTSAQDVWTHAAAQVDKSKSDESSDESDDDDSDDSGEEKSARDKNTRFLNNFLSMPSFQAMWTELHKLPASLRRMNSGDTSVPATGLFEAQVQSTDSIDPLIDISRRSGAYFLNAFRLFQAHMQRLYETMWLPFTEQFACEFRSLYLSLLNDVSTFLRDPSRLGKWKSTGPVLDHYFKLRVPRVAAHLRGCKEYKKIVNLFDNKKSNYGFLILWNRLFAPLIERFSSALEKQIAAQANNKNSADAQRQVIAGMMTPARELDSHVPVLVSHIWRHVYANLSKHLPALTAKLTKTGVEFYTLLLGDVVSSFSASAHANDLKLARQLGQRIINISGNMRKQADLINLAVPAVLAPTLDIAADETETLAVEAEMATSALGLPAAAPEPEVSELRVSIIGPHVADFQLGTHAADRDRVLQEIVEHEFSSLEAVKHRQSTGAGAGAKGSRCDGQLAPCSAGAVDNFNFKATCTCKVVRVTVTVERS